MLKAIHADEEIATAREDAIRVSEKLRVAPHQSGQACGGGSRKELTYCRFPEEHWRRIRINNPLEPVLGVAQPKQKLRKTLNSSREIGGTLAPRSKTLDTLGGALGAAYLRSPVGETAGGSGIRADAWRVLDARHYWSGRVRGNTWVNRSTYRLFWPIAIRTQT
jgi:hypothetical protein